MTKATCSVPECELPSRTRGWCKRHYQRWLRHGHVEITRVWTPHARRDDPRICRHCGTEFVDKRPGSGAPRQYCSQSCSGFGRAARIAERYETIGPCEIDGCDKKRHSTNGRWCWMHYCRYCKYGDPLKTVARRPNGFCYHCNVAVNDDTIFCSERCRKRHRVKRPGACNVCITCGAEIPAHRRADAATCSLACNRLVERAKKYGTSPNKLYALTQTRTSCAICGATDAELVVDHCHASGQIRGLLCSQCNVGIGMFAESLGRLESAKVYLEQWHAMEQQLS